MPSDDLITSTLRQVTSSLAAAEDRAGQREMAVAVGKAIEAGQHLVVAAGTGTGKTIAYLVPAIIAGKRVVVATATKALQDQLADKDLPQLEAALQQPVNWAVLKGRNNYICLQRVREIQQSQSGQLELDDMAPQLKLEVRRLSEWAGTTRSGDVGELDWMPSDRAWSSVSVSGDECPGASRCPMGQPCFAEAARNRAAAADVVVVNTYLYGLHIASGGVLLPEHDVVIFDEAHSLEDIMSDTVGISIGAGRFTSTSATLRRIIDDPSYVAGVTDAGVALRDALRRFVGQRLSRPFPDEIVDALALGRARLDAGLELLRAIDTDVEDAKQRKLRAQSQSTRLIEHIDAALADRDGYVAFVGGGPEHPRLEIAPLDVGPTLHDGVWKLRTAILTSATVPTSLRERVGLSVDNVASIDVGSPFDYEHNAMLYCALDLPDPRNAQFPARLHDELVALITAAGGRTLALFTSYKAMEAAAEACRGRLEVPILTQRDAPKAALVRSFSKDEAACLFATSGFFQGIDIPGRTLSLVTIDRLPFPAPGRSVVVGAARGARCGGVQPDRRAAGGNLACPGHGSPDSHRHRSRRGRCDGSPIGQGQLPLGHHQSAATDETNPASRRGRGPAARHCQRSAHQTVTKSTNGDDQPRVVGMVLDLQSQAPDMGVDEAAISEVFVAPDPL